MTFMGVLWRELTMLPVELFTHEDQWPAAMRDHILHAMLVKDGLVLSASDVSVGRKTEKRPNALSFPQLSNRRRAAHLF